ncbi:hypothetical protein [uncultured Kocuria sp.]|uniref:hypothetical protein n=1 Tax=uncultured Kocuria sp. TaxID=259305 RepID=UPI002635E55C|nr:hypothetical protein [uncultured Kocuria sp.]
MDVIVVPTAADVGTSAADIVAARIAGEPRTVLGVATGSSPVGIYRELARRRTEGALEPAHLTCFALDEAAASGLTLPHYHRPVPDRGDGAAPGDPSAAS